MTNESILKFIEGIKSSEYEKRKQALMDKYFAPSSREQKVFNVYKSFTFEKFRNQLLTVEMLTELHCDIEFDLLEEILIELNIRFMIIAQFDKDFNMIGYTINN